MTATRASVIFRLVLRLVLVMEVAIVTICSQFLHPSCDALHTITKSSDIFFDGQRQGAIDSKLT